MNGTLQFTTVLYPGILLLLTIYYCTTTVVQTTYIQLPRSLSCCAASYCFTLRYSAALNPSECALLDLLAELGCTGYAARGMIVACVVCATPFRLTRLQQKSTTETFTPKHFFLVDNFIMINEPSDFGKHLCRRSHECILLIISIVYCWTVRQIQRFPTAHKEYIVIQ